MNDLAKKYIVPIVILSLGWLGGVVAYQINRSGVSIENMNDVKVSSSFESLRIVKEDDFSHMQIVPSSDKTVLGESTEVNFTCVPGKRVADSVQVCITNDIKLTTNLATGGKVVRQLGEKVKIRKNAEIRVKEIPYPALLTGENKPKTAYFLVRKTDSGDATYIGTPSLSGFVAADNGNGPYPGGAILASLPPDVSAKVQASLKPAKLKATAQRVGLKVSLKSSDVEDSKSGEIVLPDKKKNPYVNERAYHGEVKVVDPTSTNENADLAISPVLPPGGQHWMSMTPDKCKTLSDSIAVVTSSDIACSYKQTWVSKVQSAILSVKKWAACLAGTDSCTETEDVTISILIENPLNKEAQKAFDTMRAMATSPANVKDLQKKYIAVKCTALADGKKVPALCLYDVTAYFAHKDSFAIDAMPGSVPTDEEYSGALINALEQHSDGAKVF